MMSKRVSHVVFDGGLRTGQNPLSAKPTEKKVASLL